MTARCPMASRRGLLAGIAALGAVRTVGAQPAAETFWGDHQGGIITPQQSHTYFMAFDVAASKKSELVAMLRAWTLAAARLSDEAKSSRLTLTFGFGPGLFHGDRFGIAGQRPESLVALKSFTGDQLVPARCDGDLSVQACADDPQIGFNAVREMISLGYGLAQPKWAQSGFLPTTRAGETARNLMGFKDGTHDPIATGGVVPAVRPGLSPDQIVWVGDEGPAWLRGGSYLVARRIRISLEHWDRTDVEFQQEVIGRYKTSGAPIGATDEFAPPDFDAVDGDGNPRIAEDSHLRLASPAFNQGAEMLRRGYGYNDGLSFTAERWPPWRQGMMLDAGLFFLAYQKDPRSGFIPVFESMSRLDALHQYTTHVGSGLFACPPGASPGGYIGDKLFG